jgi:hypothetical protein
MEKYENTGQDVLDRVTVRPIQEHEKPLWNRLIDEEHYLHNATLVGEQIRYVAEYDGDWVGLIGWSGAAYHLKGRDQFIGWSDQQRRNRLHFLVSNSRFLLRMERGECPNLASRVLRLCMDRLERDWMDRYGHGLLFAETFVDLVAYAGTCYKASNWVELGKTKGFERSGVDYYEQHDQPKRLFVRPLRPNACEVLRSEELPSPWREWEKSFDPGCTVPVPKLRSLFDYFQAMPDPRSKYGRRYPIGCILSLAACAVAGGAKGYEAIADFAEHLTQAQRRALRCWKNRKGHFTVPSVTTFSDLLNLLDNDALDRVVCTVLRELSGCDAEALAVDGKTVRSTRPTSEEENKLVLFAALDHDRPVVNNQIKVADKSNEIPSMPELLKPLDLDGTLITADALHTQRETARHIVQDKGADYLFTVKDNQPELKKRIEAHFEGRVFSLGPSHHR